MLDLAQNTENAQQIIIQLLFTDLDLSFTFLETARVTVMPETRQRNLANAVKIYRTISAKTATLYLPLSLASNSKQNC